MNGCMVILRYWQLFHGKQYTVNGKKARDQVLKYYNRHNNKRRRDTETCEGQTNQIRLRAALTRPSSSSRILGNSFIKRLQ